MSRGLRIGLSIATPVFVILGLTVIGIFGLEDKPWVVATFSSVVTALISESSKNNHKK